MSTTQTDRTRDFVSQWLAGVPVIQASEYRPFPMTDEQMHAQAIHQARVRHAEKKALHEARMRVCAL